MNPRFFVAIVILLFGEWVPVETVGQITLAVCWCYVVYSLGRYLYARIIQGRTDVRDPFGFDD